MTRRELFAALIAPLVAVKAIAKPLPTSGVAIAHAWRENGNTFYSWDGNLSSLDDHQIEAVRGYFESQCFGSKIKPKEKV